MKRYGNLIEQISEYKNLNYAFYKAAKSKRIKPEVILYEKELEKNLLILQKEIQTGNVNVGNYHYFKILDPKERMICAASFPERVLHHAIMNICHPVFEKKLIHTTYATRPEKGIYKAIELAKKSVIKYKYVAKLDVRKYFDSISHTILMQKLQTIFKDLRLLLIFHKIISNYSKKSTNVSPSLTNLPQALSNVSHNRTGIPIGNLTSQYFANFYLSPADRFAKEILKIPSYIRYMDDMLLFFNKKLELKNYVKNFISFIENNLDLKIKPHQIYSQIQGVPFLGYKILPYQVRLNSNSKKRFIRKYNKYISNLEQGIWTEKEYQLHILPLFAFLLHADTKSLRKNIIFAK